MSINLISYWRNWINNDIDIPITKDGYMVRYIMANQYTSEGVKHWVCCTSKKKLYAFIKYVLLPSIIISKNIGIKDGELHFDVCEYDETIGILEYVKKEDYKEAIEEFNSWFDEIDKLESEDAEFKEISNFIEMVCKQVGFRQRLFLEVDVFENISSVGKELIRQYEEDGMVDILEDNMGMAREEIENLFYNIDDNEFMLKKITTLLNERFH